MMPSKKQALSFDCNTHTHARAEKATIQQTMFYRSLSLRKAVYHPPKTGGKNMKHVHGASNYFASAFIWPAEPMVSPEATTAVFNGINFVLICFQTGY